MEEVQRNVKPRLRFYKYLGMWICRTGKGTELGTAGWGTTAAQAYRNWQLAMGTRGAE